jgi:hypothetical protein
MRAHYVRLIWGSTRAGQHCLQSPFKGAVEMDTRQQVIHNIKENRTLAGGGVTRQPTWSNGSDCITH